MASISHRASGFWSGATTSGRMSYFEGSGDQDEDVEALLSSGIEQYDGRSPLDRTIDRIGMGSYQWTLLSLCGLGWLADNMWIQAVAIILPRVQQHFSISDQHIGIFSSSMFGGMMLGAVGWGTCSDLLGRTAAFNATLFLTSLFGVAASFANSFPGLCVALFFLGSAVGGSMPTDGTLLLEHMPNGKQYLVTALSVFFSFGAVLSAVVGLLVIPSHSCPPAPEPCDVLSQNMGWKYLLIALGTITMSMFLARIVFFRLHESPRYLAYAGRPQEAIVSLQMISKFNGSELELGLDDVSIHVEPPPPSPPQDSNFASGDQDSSRAPLLANLDTAAAAAINGAGGRIQHSSSDDTLVTDALHRQRMLTNQTSRDVLRNNSPEGEPKDYSATGKSDVSSDSASTSQSETESLKGDASTLPSPPLSPRRRSFPPRTNVRLSSSFEGRRMSTASSSSHGYTKSSGLFWKLPRWLRRPLGAWWDRIAMVLSPEWKGTTLLVWGAWWAMSLAYTMFNVYLPKLLEGRPGGNDAPKTLHQSLWDVVIYAIGGCPGALLGAYMVETPLGRRWSLVGSTLVTALFCVLFAIAPYPWAVSVSTVGISLSATVMWAVLYGWTPEIFGTKVRGTACGIASALSRIGGMIAPMLGGTLLMIDNTFPVYASVVVFVIAAICVFFLKEDSGGGDQARGSEQQQQRAIIH